MADKKILTIFILAIVTTILLSLMLTDFLMQRNNEQLTQQYLSKVVKMNNINLQSKGDYDLLIDNLVTVINSSSVNDSVDFLTQRYNEKFLDLIDEFNKKNEENQRKYQEQINKLLKEINDTKRRETFLIMPTGGVS